MHPSIAQSAAQPHMEAAKCKNCTSGTGNPALDDILTLATMAGRAAIADPGEIIGRMVADLRDSPVLAAEDAPITREFFLNLGWTRQQIAAYAPRAIEQFREGA